MTTKKQECTIQLLNQNDFQSFIQQELCLAIRLVLTTVMETEINELIKALPYQRTPERRDYRNGYYTRDLETSLGVIEDLMVPRTRNGYQTQLFDRYQRRQAELDKAICEMFIAGVSTRRVGQVIESLTGSQPSASTVSRVFHTLESEYEAWKKRPLEAYYDYAFADGTYFTVMYDNEGHKMPILAVIGIDLTGNRSVLGFTVGDRENQQAWESLFDDLKARGVQHVSLWITDGNQAMINALQIKFPNSSRQRCVQHKMENVLGHVPEKQRDAVRHELSAIFYQESREAAEQEVAAFCAKFEATYPTAIACLKRDLDACLTFYAFPKSHWKTIRTTNVIERLFNEVKRRTNKMAAAFRNENSCLLMFYAIIRSIKFRKIPMHQKIA